MRENNRETRVLLDAFEIHLRNGSHMCLTYTLPLHLFC
jgi:hypothetical protein